MSLPDSTHRFASLWKTVLVLLLCANALAPGQVKAASANLITVTSRLDTADPGKCMLRDAITAANTNTHTGGCPGGVLGMDTINFSLGAICQVTLCTIVLTGPLPPITQDLTINGSSTNVVISGANLYTVFTLGAVDASISNLTVSYGKGDFGAGIIINGANLTLNNVRVSANHAHSGSGVYESSGALYVNNSSFLGNVAEVNGFGGGFGQAGGIAVFSNSVFSGNSGGLGGALGSLGSSHLDLSTSVFDANNASIWGGAVYLQDQSVQATITASSFTNNTTSDATAGHGGGAIFSYHATLTLSNSTLSGNSSNGDGGGLFDYGSPVNLNNVTVSGNTARESGGGIYALDDGPLNPALLTLNNLTITNNTANSDNNISGNGGGIANNGGTVILRNSILAGNFDTSNNAGPGAIQADCVGVFASPQYNLLGRNDVCPGFVNLADGNKVGTPSNPIDALLAPLASNGGATQTHALLPGSPAFNAGNPAAPGGSLACAATDQRGLKRPLGSTCDMGAFEAGMLVFAPAISR